MGGPYNRNPSKEEIEEVYSHSGEARVMSIEGRMAHRRERTSGMNDAERAWRKQWLKDQVLTAREPVYIPRDNPALINPIRKFYRWPLDTIFLDGLAPYIGYNKARSARYFTGKVLMMIAGVYATFYYFKYNTNTWEKTGSWRVTRNNPQILPGDENWPLGYTKKSRRDYADSGFLNSIFGKKYDNSGRGFDDDGWVPEYYPFTDVKKTRMPEEEAYLKPRREEQTRITSENAARLRQQERQQREREQK